MKEGSAVNLGVLLMVLAQAVSMGAMEADFAPDYTDLIIELQVAMENMEGTYGIDFRDLESGVGASIQAKNPFFCRQHHQTAGGALCHRADHR